MHRNIWTFLIAWALSLGGCDSANESTYIVKKDLGKTNKYGDDICLIMDKTGKEVEWLCREKPPKVELYQKHVWGGFGAHSGGFGYTPDKWNKLHAPGIGNIPQTTKQCTKTTPYNQITGDALKEIEYCS